VRHTAVGVPATTANLGPGFDALGAALTLRLVVASVDREAAHVVASGEGADEVPTDDGNLVWRSFDAACKAFGSPVPDVTLRVHNDVPLARGLGSSSAAIVAGIALARAVLEVAVGDAAVAELATDLEGHPDNVVPALFGGLTASAVAPDGRLVVRRVRPHTRLRPIVFVASSTQSTDAARGVLPASLPAADVAQQAARAVHVLGALAGSWPGDVALAGDLLHEPPRMAVMAASGELIDALRQAGVHAWLSGAGPSVAAVVPRRGAGVPDAVSGLARSLGFAVRELDWDLRGTHACPTNACAISGRAPCWQCPRHAV